MEPPLRIPRRVPAALACLALLACGGGHPPSPVPPAPTPPSPAPSADPGAPASGPGSTLWEVELHYDSDQLGGPWTDGDGNLFMIHLSGGQITAEKRDASGAVEWERHVEPACSHGWFALGATDDGRFAVEVASCPYGSAYRPTAERVTLLDPGGAVASQFTTGWGAALAVNGFGETYAVSSDVGAPVVPSPDGSSLVSGWPVLLRLIRPDGTDAWVDREGPPSLLPGSLQATHDGGAVALSGDGRTAYRIDRGGNLLWASDLPVTVTPYVYPYTAALRDGSLAVAVETSGVVTYGAGQAGVAGQRGRALVVVGSDGRPRTIVPLPATAPGDGWNVALTALSDGGVAAWEYAAACQRLWAFSSDLSLRWERRIDASCGTRIASAVSTPRGLVLLRAGRTPPSLVSLQQ